MLICLHNNYIVKVITKKLLWVQRYVKKNGGKEYDFEGEKLGLKEKAISKSLRRDIAGENFPNSEVDTFLWLRCLYAFFFTSCCLYRALYMWYPMLPLYHQVLLYAALNTSWLFPFIFISTIIFLVWTKVSFLESLCPPYLPLFILASI